LRTIKVTRKTAEY